MNKKQELIDYVIGNEFITKPNLQEKFTKLLDEALYEQLILHGVNQQSELLLDFWMNLPKTNKNKGVAKHYIDKYLKSTNGLYKN